jgi:hypothetical protein
VTAPLDDQDLLDGFERATLSADQFGHAEHVRTAWLFVRRDGLPQALASFPTALRRFAQAHGAPKLYHVTITWAYLLLIHARQQAGRSDNWDDFAAANNDLLSWKPSVLDDYYRPETLWSEFARHTFVMPDRGIRERSSGAGLDEEGTPCS